MCYHIQPFSILKCVCLLPGMELTRLNLGTSKVMNSFLVSRGEVTCWLVCIPNIILFPGRCSLSVGAMTPPSTFGCSSFPWRMKLYNTGSHSISILKTKTLPVFDHPPSLVPLLFLITSKDVWFKDDYYYVWPTFLTHDNIFMLKILFCNKKVCV